MKGGSTHIRDALAQWMEHDATAVLLGESVGRGGGNGGTSEGLLARFGPERVIDTPIAERTAFGLALGMALGGRPVALELSSARSLLAVAEMLADAAQMASSGFRPALTVRVPIGGEAGPHIDAPAADLLAALTGLKVVCITSETAASVLASALGSGVTVVLEPRAELSRRAAALEIPSRARIVRDGHHATVLAWGSAVSAAVQAADLLAAEGISTRVVDLVQLAPLDPEVGALVSHTGRVIAAHPSDGALARRILRVALDAAFLYLESPPGDCPADVESVRRAVHDSVHY